MSPFETTAAECEADRAADDQFRREERRLLAKTLAWARRSGYEKAREYEGGQFCGYSWKEPFAKVVFDPAADMTIYYGRSAFSPESVREAVDVLVALGVLPVEMSSAFDAGRESAYEGGDTEWCVEIGANRARVWSGRTEAMPRVQLDYFAQIWPGQAWLMSRRVGPWTEVAG